jgi:3-oxoadipate enol-lactonase
MDARTGPASTRVPARPDGQLPYDWDMVLAIRGQIDNPDPAWLGRLSQITAQTLVLGGHLAEGAVVHPVIMLLRPVVSLRLKWQPGIHCIYV